MLSYTDKYDLAGQKISLYNLENSIIRQFKEPRIHFAIVCASKSCPKLASRAYTAENLNDMLDAAAKGFINDRAKNRIDEKSKTIYLPKIFEWYENDFNDAGGALKFIARYLPEKDAQEVLKGNYSLKYLDYDWTLNGEIWKEPFVRLKNEQVLISSLLRVSHRAHRGNRKRHHEGKIIQEAVPLSAQDIKPLLIGAAVPDVKLTTVQGAELNLKDALAGQPAILIFYRGGWCPYCNLQLGQIQRIDSSLLAMGYRIFAISPDRPAMLTESLEKHDLTYTLLSDHSMEAAKAFGIAFRVDDATLAKYRQYGINLESSSGETHHLLPAPSVFIISKDGKLGFTYVSPDYKIRIDPDVLLEAAKAVLKMAPDNSAKGKP